MADRAKSAMGGGKKSKSKKSGHKPHSIHIHRGKSGGFIVHHHHKPDENGVSPEMEEHVVPDMDSLHDHLDQAMGDQGAAPAATPPPEAEPAPVPAPAAPTPAPQAIPPGM